MVGLCGSSCKELFNVKSRRVATAATLRYRLLIDMEWCGKESYTLASSPPAMDIARKGAI